MNRVAILGAIIGGFLVIAWGEFLDGKSSAINVPAQDGVIQTIDLDLVGISDVKKSSNGKLLAPSDFNFVGSYPFSADNQATFGMGLTHRRVNGELRFLTTAYSG